MEIKISKTFQYIALILLLFFYATYSISQVLPGPKPQWMLEDWAAVNFDLTAPVTQEESGDEWYYNHIKIYEK